MTYEKQEFEQCGWTFNVDFFQSICTTVLDDPQLVESMDVDKEAHCKVIRGFPTTQVGSPNPWVAQGSAVFSIKLLPLILCPSLNCISWRRKIGALPHELSEDNPSAYSERPTGKSGRCVPPWKTWATVVQVSLSFINHYHASSQSGKLFSENLLQSLCSSGRNWCTKDYYQPQQIISIIPLSLKSNSLTEVTLS